MINKNCPNRLIKSFYFAIIIAFISLIYVFQAGASAATRDTINFQGKIVQNTSGNEGLNVTTGSTACILAGPSNDTCDFRARFYDAAVGGNLLGTDEFVNVEVGEYDGIFNLALGEGSFTAGTEAAFEDIFINNSDVYVEIGFAPGGAQSYTETFSRMAVRAAPFAISTNNISGFTADDFVKFRPSSVQTDSTTLASIFINKTGASGNILQLQKNGTDVFVVNNSGYLGIGVTSPSQAFDLIGSIELQATTTSTSGVIYKGADRFIHNFQHPTGNTAIPFGQNTFVGVDSGNFTMGSTAVSSNQSSYNTGIGYNTLSANTTGSQNTAIGMGVLSTNSTGNSNTASGAYSLATNTTGSQNTATGLQALYFNTTGSQNTATGLYSLYSNTTGLSNTGSGRNSLYSNTTGSWNTAIGAYTLSSNTTGSSNTAIGEYAGVYTTAFNPNQTSSYSLYLGAATKAFANGGVNEIVLGYNTTGFGSNTSAYGNSSMTQHIFQSGNLGIGLTSATYKLDVSGGAGIVGRFSGRVIGGNAVNSNEFVTLGQVSASLLPSGTTGQTLRYSGSAWVANSLLYNNGTNIGINTSSPTERLSVMGNATLGDNTIANGTNNYLSIWGYHTSAAAPKEARFVMNSSGRLIVTGDYEQLELGEGGGTGRNLVFRRAANNAVIGIDSFGDLQYSGSFGAVKFANNLRINSDNYIGLGNSSSGFYRIMYDSANLNSLRFTYNGATNEAGRLTETGSWNFLSNALFINSANSRVGVGTATPGYLFDVSGGTGIVGQFSGRVIGGNAVNSNEFVTLGQVSSSLLPSGTTGQTLRHNGSTWVANSLIYNDGINVGIGIVPTSKLHVAGNIIAADASGTPNISAIGLINPYLFAQDTTNNVVIKLQALDSSGYIGSEGNHSLSLITNNAPRLTIDSAGSVGIGIGSPSYLFHVSGGSGIVGQFSGRVIGGNAVNSNEFVTKSQLDAVAAANPTLAQVLTAGNLSGGTAIDMQNALITNIGNGGTDFKAGGGLSLAGDFTSSALSGFGTGVPTSGQAVTVGFTSSNANAYGIRNNLTLNGTNTANRVRYGLYNYVGTTALHGSFTETIYGSYNEIIGAAGADITTAYASYNRLEVDGTGFGGGSITSGYGTYNAFISSSDATVNEGYGSFNFVTASNQPMIAAYGSYNLVSASASVTNAYGTYINLASLGTITNGYGLYIAGISGVNSSYGVFVNGGVNNYLSGNLGVGGGASTPTLRLDVRNSNNASPGIALFRNTNTGTSAGVLALDVGNTGTIGATQDFIQFRKSSGSVVIGQIEGNGSGGVDYTTTSDMRLKQNATASSVGLNELMQIQVREYNFIGSSQREVGFFAQELHSILPGFVSVGGADPNTQPWGIDYGRLTPVIIRAIQQQQAQIDALSGGNSYWTLGSSTLSTVYGVKGANFSNQNNSFVVSALGNVTANNYIVNGTISGLNGTLNVAGNLSANEIFVKKVNVDPSIAGASIGSGTIVAGADNVVISSAAVTAQSKVFVTPKGDLAGQTYYVSEIAAGSFKLVLSGPAGADVEFDWWVVN